MEIPASLLERLRRNEEIAQKFSEIETAILGILNFQDFLEQLLKEIGAKFQVPYIWISIIKESLLAGYLSGIKDSELLKTATAFVPRDRFLSITRNRTTPLLANQNLERILPLVPEVSACDLGSVALAPITLDGEIVGSINQASPDPRRFEPGIDTSLLERLAVKVSLCLSNVTAHEQLRFLAFHDPLTNLLNRGVMEKILEREFLRARRYHTELSVIFLDLDDFKSINDTHGHDAGDRTLCFVADHLMGLKRDSDIVARYAGDEFVAILPSTAKGPAVNYMKRVQSQLASSPLVVGNARIFPQLSFGVAMASDPEMSSSSMLLKAADQALYRAKHKKKTGKTE